MAIFKTGKERAAKNIWLKHDSYKTGSSKRKLEAAIDADAALEKHEIQKRFVFSMLSGSKMDVTPELEWVKIKTSENTMPFLKLSAKRKNGKTP